MAQNDAALNHLDRYGFVVLEGLLDPAQLLEPVMDEYGAVLESLAEDLFARGAISSTHDDLPFGRRVIEIYAESGRVHNQYFDFSLPQKKIQADTPFWAGPAVFDLLTSPPLLDAVESVVGPEIYSNPVQHVRIKVPESLCPRSDKGDVLFGATPWHQDVGVITEEADETEMLTVWFPLRDAAIENGCLQVLPGSHRGEILTHCSSVQGLQIPSALLKAKEARALPMRAGDVLFMHRKTAHAALPNLSHEIRWSLDLRYHPIGQPTGRPAFPGFVARSRSNPDLEMRDPQTWHDSWLAARDQLALEGDPIYNRWDFADPVCA